jgi:hypothetical protein
MYVKETDEQTLMENKNDTRDQTTMDDMYVKETDK